MAKFEWGVPKFDEGPWGPEPLERRTIDQAMPYFQTIHSLRHRQALTKIRISAHILQIEKGRYCRPVIPREQGICKFCRSTENACDDEIHFLTIVAVNFHQRWVFFADFSLNSWSIYMKFWMHSLQLFRRLPRKFREIWVSISKVRPFDM